MVACKKLQKPSDAEARALSKLFPSSSRKRCVPAFDPCKEAVNLPQAKKKKKGCTSQGRAVNITVIMLSEQCRCIPRGKFRKALNDQSRIVTVKFTRAMTGEHVGFCFYTCSSRAEPQLLSDLKIIHACFIIDLFTRIPIWI